MNIKTYNHSKGIWLFIDNRHKKTIPKKYAPYIMDSIQTLDFSRKRLSENERQALAQKFILKDLTEFIDELKIISPLVYDLIKSSNVVSVRKVIGYKSNRFECIFNNGVKIKTTRKIFTEFEPKSPTVHLNY